MGYLYLFYSAPDRGVKYCNDRVRVCPCVCLRLCLFAIISLELHVRYSLNFFVHTSYGRVSVLFWRLNYALRISGFVDGVVFAHKLRLLDVAARLWQ